MIKYKLKTLIGGGACPEQYFGRTVDGLSIYVRIRGGWASLEIGEILVDETQYPNDPYKGCFENNELAVFMLRNFEPDKVLIDFLYNNMN